MVVTKRKDETIPPVVTSAPAVTPSVVDTTVKGTVPGTLDPNSAAYQKLAKMGLDDAKIQSMYGNLMKKSEIVDTAKFNSAVAPQKVESLASVDTKSEQPAPQKNEVAQSLADVKNIPTLDPNKDDSEQRQAQILANLKNFEATTPEIFNNKAKYDQVVGRANKSPLQQQIVDNYFNSVKATKEKIAAVDKAKVELSSMSDTVLGYLKPTAEQLSVINNDPALLARYTAATQQRSILDQIQKGFTPAEVPAIDGYDGIGGNIPQEIVQMQATLAQQAEEYNTIQRKIDTVDEDVRSEYEGSGVSDAYIQAKINKRKAELTKEAANKKGTFDITSSKIAALGTQAETIKAEQTAKSEQLTKLLDNFGKLYNIQQSTPEAQAQAVIDKYKAENPSMDTGTPDQQNMAINNALISYYDKYSNIIQRPKDQVISDVLQYAKDKNISVSQALKENFILQLQNKKEYKQILNKEIGIDDSVSRGKVGVDSKGNDIYGFIDTKNQTVSGATGTQGVADTSTGLQTYPSTGMKGLGLKNNNPGNIKDSSFGNPIGKSTNGFTQFETPEDGFDALVEKIKFNQTNPKSSYYGNTIQQYFQKYAPSTDNNNPNAYANEVANRLGVSTSTKISNVDPIKFAAAIAKHDSGYDYSTYGTIRGTSNQKQNTSGYDQLSSTAQQILDGTLTMDIASKAGVEGGKQYMAALNEIKQAGASVVDTKLYQALSDSLDALKKISPTSKGFQGAVGASLVKLPIFWEDAIAKNTDAYYFKKNYENALAQLTTPKLQNMKGLGSMSDIEFENIKNLASEGLNLGNTEDNYIASYNSLVSKITKNMKDLQSKNIGINSISKINPF